MKLYLIGITALIVSKGFAQLPQDTTKQEEEDFSMYENVESTGSKGDTKVYCSQKIIGLSPSKLLSVGFDFVGANKLTLDTLSNYLNTETDINYNYGTRFAANFPVISNNKVILSLGVSYLDFKYNFKNKNQYNPIIKPLSDYGLRSYGVNATLFKPLNSKYFLILQTNADLNSAYKFETPNANELKVSGAALFGVKPHERRQYGFGVTRSYRGGGVMYTPVILYNYTFKNKKWGVEMLLPAKANVRYTINSRNLLFAGFELEGNSYYMKSIKTDFNLPFNNSQLKRSEIRPRITYEFSVYKFLWLSLQAGYRLDYRFNLDEGDKYRTSSSKPYIMENKLSGAYYFNISLNLVSP